MKQNLLQVLLLLCIILHKDHVTAQQIQFNLIEDKNLSTLLKSLAQDKQGYIWGASYYDGLVRYDGTDFNKHVHDPHDPNSIGGNSTSCIAIDSANMIWIGLATKGLDKYDPQTNTITHFVHNPEDRTSLSNDTIKAIATDAHGLLWVATNAGLDVLNPSTGVFSHFFPNERDSTSLSSNQINVLYVDKQNTLWVGCGVLGNSPDQTGGLHRFNRDHGTFTRFLHQSQHPGSLSHNSVWALFEDQEKNFWIGTSNNGLQHLNRETGVFTNYYFKLSGSGSVAEKPFYPDSDYTHITSISEDRYGIIWILTLYNGIVRYDKHSGITTHFGTSALNYIPVPPEDTLGGFSANGAINSILTSDGLIWLTANNGLLYNCNKNITTIQFYPISQEEANALYFDDDQKDLWLATNNGLVRKNLNTQKEKIWVSGQNDNSLSSDVIYGMRADREGNLWLGTNGGGLCKFNPKTEVFTRFQNDPKNHESLSSNSISAIYIDQQNIVWIATVDSGIDRLDPALNKFTHYPHEKDVKTSLISNVVFAITHDQENALWVATNSGLDRMDGTNGQFDHFLSKSNVKCVFVDHRNVVWAGTEVGLYYYDLTSNTFVHFQYEPFSQIISESLSILEDHQLNLWISTRRGIYKIDKNRTTVNSFVKNNGVHPNPMGWSDNFIAKDGQLFIGHFNGYYAFYPEKIKLELSPPLLSFSAFYIRDELILPTEDGVLNVPLWKAIELNLTHRQNTFAFEFIGLDFLRNDELTYYFMLENYDNLWHSLGSEPKAYFFNVPSGTYNLRIKCQSADNQFSEKNIKILITPPWWRTWWAYVLFVFVAVGGIWIVTYLRSIQLRQANRKLEEKVTQRTEQLNTSLEDLKNTQAQLIQSEKMASLGQVTAGIAHEIQNPLNFVNNFSEVNAELIEELKSEVEQQNMNEVKSIADTIRDNQEKITFHGKRADAIVKGMLQHSRSSNGVKEPTDINALADEYLRLAYHGLRAKDKSFNATMQTDFDESIGMINVIPQDIGRVILNLITNAFYAVSEKQKMLSQTPYPLEGGAVYIPTVSVITKKQLPLSGGKGFNEINSVGYIAITVSDNGTGIPKSALDKVFQPFFTTKPTGQGTGLGLSLSYDIVKAHGGELKVETKEGEGTTFIIHLPNV
jgi:signal transduction histidine kinase/ligand-binding sensor domain-containing protein